MNKSFKTIFMRKIILICELFTELKKSDILIPKLGSRIFFVFLELCLMCTLYSADNLQKALIAELRCPEGSEEHGGVDSIAPWSDDKLCSLTSSQPPVTQKDILSTTSTDKVLTNSMTKIK